MRFKIPKKFQVYDLEVNVVMVDDLVETKDMIGACAFDIDTIYLQNPKKIKGLTKEKLEHVFFHELIHYCLYAMYGATGLALNEKFVNSLGAAVHQALKTMK